MASPASGSPRCKCGSAYQPESSYWIRYGERVATCPVCGLTVPAHRDRRESAGPSVIDDTLPGGARWMQNLGHKPVWVETKTELKRELETRGLEIKDAGTHTREDRSPWATRTRLR